MRYIEKRTWTPYYNKLLSGEKNTEIRLADFDLDEGDIIIFKEWNPDTGYTGRQIWRIVEKMFKVHVADFWKLEEIKKHGLYLIELDKGDASSSALERKDENAS